MKDLTKQMYSFCMTLPEISGGKYKLMTRKGNTTAPIKISATAKLTKNILLTVRNDLNEMILTTTGIFPPHINNERTQFDVSMNIENESNVSFLGFSTSFVTFIL
ncbi:unnamed protein product [Owenia fusiformis]|uniref:Uncharacterized protein n=1 Tax=Owenia fusiformis TaxID=6347 RepID=A0A8J1XSD3_OWEFU|nr:unnamed protein product [Owenia fusiformis]